MCYFRRSQKAEKKPISFQQTNARQNECSRHTKEMLLLVHPDFHAYERLARASLENHLSVHLQMCSPGAKFLPAFQQGLI